MGDVVVDGVTVQVSSVARGYPLKAAGGELAGFTGGPDLLGVSGVMSSDMGSYTVTFTFDEALWASGSVEVSAYTETGFEVVLVEDSITVSGDRVVVVYSRVGQEASFDRLFADSDKPVFTVRSGSLSQRGVRDADGVYGYPTSVVCDSCPVFTVSGSTPVPVVLDGLIGGPDLVSVTEVSSDADLAAGQVRFRYWFDKPFRFPSYGVPYRLFWYWGRSYRSFASADNVEGFDIDGDGLFEGVDVRFNSFEARDFTTVGVVEGAVVGDVVVDGVTVQVSSVARGYPLKAAGGELAGFTGGPELLGVSGVMSSDMGSYTVTFTFDEPLRASGSVEVREFVQTGFEVDLVEDSITVSGDRVVVVYSRVGQEASFDRLFADSDKPVFTVSRDSSDWLGVRGAYSYGYPDSRVCDCRVLLGAVAVWV